MKLITVIFAFLNFFSLAFAGDATQEDSSGEENGDEQELSVGLPDLSDCAGLIQVGTPLHRFPHELCTALTLKWVVFTGCPINDLIPEEFWNNRNLEKLGFISCGITGTLAPRLGKLHNLSSLNFSNNQLSGAIPENIVKLMKLETLVLSRNQFSAIPHLATLTSLAEIDCSNNQLRSLGSLPAGLKKLNLSNNQLEGPVTMFNKLKKLEVLELANNNFRGPLGEFEHIHELKTLNLSENPLHMCFPREILQLYQLQSLEMANVGLRGTIPEEFCQLTKLVLINLGQNYLEGSIPKNMNQLGSLEYIIIDTNSLTGKLPQFAPSLRVLYAVNNDLEGSFNVSDFPHLTQLGIFSVKSATDRIFTAELNQLSAETLVHFLNIQQEVSGIYIVVTVSKKDIGALICDYDLTGRRKLVFHCPSNSSDDETEHINSINAIIEIANRHLGRKKEYN